MSIIFYTLSVKTVRCVRQRHGGKNLWKRCFGSRAKTSSGNMQMSMHKLNLHTILQNYPLWCCCHVMYKLLYPSIRVRTALLYRLGSGLWLVLVLVLRCNAIAHTVLHVSPSPEPQPSRSCSPRLRPQTPTPRSQRHHVTRTLK